jgi:hypothetical protein
MQLLDKEKFKELKSKHQSLYFQWKRGKKPCVICGEEVGNEKDHLPPKALLPKALRSSKTEFFSYPVCTKCNRSSSDEDFLFYTIVAWGVNQSSYLNKKEPTDSDLLALHEESIHKFTRPSKEQRRREKLINKHLENPCINGTKYFAVKSGRININQTLVKIVKSIYWLHTDGDILQNYNPGWWIRTGINTSEPNFIQNHLKTTNADVYWDGRFIVHYSIGQPSDNVGGVLFLVHFIFIQAGRLVKV